MAGDANETQNTDPPSMPPPISSSAPALAPIVPTASAPPHLERHGSLTLQLPRRRTTQGRIEDLLESARERAESLSGQSSPRLHQPLLSGSPRAGGHAFYSSLSSSPQGGSRIADESSADDDDNNHATGTVVRRQPERQPTLNYQSTTQTSHSPRRRTTVAAHNGGGSEQQTPHMQQSGDTNNDGNRRDEIHSESPWRERLRYFQSIELENKGSVARDHLALERTFLAWLRTSLAFASIGIAITQLFRLNTSLAHDSEQRDTLRHLGKPLGSTFLAISILTLFLGYKRYLQAQHWVIRGKFPASRGTIMLVSFIAFAVTVASLVVVLAVQSGQ
ncbi:hypothetical protein B0H66DRAFT_541721 [Apodospora peruviana]|uniref:DUF202 domain-containing protein n=1 Tax=Apodospora peruviana TaxID=516989 RepID=A0AAE0MEN0_9PEZI|nr:hypothetical protein B0H66DRAFT_541721 [Apodospora peruviana]